MPKKRLGAEQIVTKLRQVEVLQSVNAGVNLQQFSGVKVQHGRTQEGPRYRGPFGLTSVSMLRRLAGLQWGARPWHGVTGAWSERGGSCRRSFRGYGRGE